MLETSFANYRELNWIFLFYSNPITLYIGLIQENLMENSIQDSLPYILNPHGPC